MVGKLYSAANSFTIVIAAYKVIIVVERNYLSDMENDLIAAIATAPGQAGIAVVRISGEGALNVLEKIFHHGGGYESHRLYYGKVAGAAGAIDYAMAAFMRAPHSYTGDDTAEIFCHGGYAVSRAVLQAALDAGCRMAEAGEFTKRAFLNGRLDLSQAEAVSDLIAANATLAAQTALTALSGRIRGDVESMRDKLLDFLAKIEVCIDYPEDDVEEQTAEGIIPEIKGIIEELAAMLETSHRGRIYKEGLLVAIAGRPNVGKSSLLNAIMGESRAIVTTTPGTTRDTLEADVEINGLEVRLVDTAGIRESGDEIERLGIERAEGAIDRADIILFVIDNSEGVSGEDLAIYSKVKDKPHIIVINKMDSGEFISAEMIEKNFPGSGHIFISALNRTNIVALESAIFDFVGVGELGKKETVLSNLRHIEAVKAAKSRLGDALEALEGGVPIDMASVDIRGAWQALGEVTGDTVDEQIVERIFSKFCVGK